MLCGKRVGEHDRGLITACSPSFWEHWKLQVDGVLYTVCSYHLTCWLSEVVNGKLPDSVTDRMEGATEEPVEAETSGWEKSAQEQTEMNRDRVEGEDYVEPGGWE